MRPTSWIAEIDSPNTAHALAMTTAYDDPLKIGKTMVSGWWRSETMNVRKLRP